MASLPGPHKSLIQKASRDSAQDWGATSYPGLRRSVISRARSINRFKLDRGPLGPSKRFHLTDRYGSVNACEDWASCGAEDTAIPHFGQAKKKRRRLGRKRDGAECEPPVGKY